MYFTKALLLNRNICGYYQFVDSPSSTSAITYAASYNTSATSGSLHLNRTVTDTDGGNYERGVSSIILQEIAG